MKNKLTKKHKHVLIIKGAQGMAQSSLAVITVFLSTSKYPKISVPCARKLRFLGILLRGLEQLKAHSTSCARELSGLWAVRVSNGDRLTFRNSSIYQNLRKTSAFLTIGLFWLCGSSAGAVSISQDYEWQHNSVKLGSLVSIKKDDPKAVELTNTDNKDYAVGVIVEKGRALISLSLSSGENVAVATDGEVVALVSDINGIVKKGDLVGASAVSGVAQRLDEQSAESQRLIGIALEDFDLRRVLTVNPANSQTAIRVGYMPITIINRDKSPAASESSPGIKSAAVRLTGKDTSLVRILSSLAVFILVALVAAMLIVGSVKGSFISLGRNPLASSSIYSSLARVSVLSVAIMLIGAALAYAVLVI